MRVCPDCKNRFDDGVERCPQDGAALVELRDGDQGVVVERQELQRLQALEAARSRYTIIERIGQGGWGGVYRAYQHSTRREVALKVLRRDVAEDVSARRRFHREAEAISRLKHPNTVTIFDFGETPDGLLFIAMEYIEGSSLDQTVRRDGPLAPLRATRIARQVALSLAEAHAKGIVHRDIKPHNIMLAAHEDGQEFVKVLDFGVAKIVGADTRLTATGSTFGTPEYMSPEQVQSRELDHRSDLYSLGVVLYEMLSGTPPFSGNSAVTVALCHVRNKPPPIKAPADVPESLAALTRRLLSKHPTDRGGGAAEIARELEAIELELQTGFKGSRKGALPLRRLLSAGISNWAAVVTVLAVVCALTAAYLVMRERLFGSGGGPQADLVEQAAVDEPGEKGNAGGGPARGTMLPGKERPVPSPASTVASLPASVPSVLTTRTAAEGGTTPVAGKPPGEQAVPARRAEGAEGRTGEQVRGGSDGVPGEGSSTPPGGGSMPGGTTVDTGASGAAKAGSGDSEGGKGSSGASGVAKVGSGDSEGGKGTRGASGGSKAEGEASGASTLEVELTAGALSADVIAGGKVVCQTPCRLTGAEGEARRVRISRKGFRSHETTVVFGRDQSVAVTLSPVPLSAEDSLKGDGEPLKEDGLK